MSESLPDRMNIYDINGVHSAETEAEAKAVFSLRYGDGVNCFWFGHDDKKYPAMCLMVNGDQAHLNYFPAERIAGFVSDNPTAPSGPDHVFYMNNLTAEEYVPNQEVITTSAAMEAAIEFFHCPELPKAIKWFEL